MQTSEIVPCLDRVQRILAVDASYTISRMKVLERLPGNPIGIRYRWVDETAVALMSRLPSFARVVGLRAGQESQIEPLVSWYRDHSIKPTFEMVAGQYDANLGRELARLGFFQSGFHVSLIGEPRGLAYNEDQVPTEQVTDASSMEGFSMPMWEVGELPKKIKPSQSQRQAVPEPARMVALSGPCEWPTRRCRDPVHPRRHSLSRPMRRPIPHFADEAFTQLCCGGEFVGPKLQEQILYSAAPLRFRQAIATWSASA